MNKLVRLITVIVLLLPEAVPAQTYDQEEYDPGKKPFKVGIHTGLTVSGLRSDGIVNNINSYGMHGGIYVRKQLNKTLHFESGISGSMSGARFNNGDTGYSRFSTLNLELPQLLLLSLDAKFHNCIMLGVQPNYILRSQLYVGIDPQATYADFYDLPLNKLNVFALAGYQFNAPFVGFRVMFKYGLLNMNKALATYNAESIAHPGRFFKDMNPPFNFSNPLNSWMLDVSILF